MSLVDLNAAFRFAERTLNILGYIPIISSLSAILRFGLGKAMIIGGLGTATFSFVGSIFASNEERQRQLGQYAVKSLEYVAHGALNVGRSFLEMIPFVSLFTCWPYDMRNRKFLRYTDQYNIAFAI